MTRRYSLDGRLGNLIVRGNTLREDVAASVTSAKLSLSSSEVTQLTITLVDDADLTLLDSRLFDPGTPHTRGSRCDYGGLALEVRAIEVAPRGSDHALTVTARSLPAGNLRRRRGALARRNVSPTQFAALEAKAVGVRFVGQPSAVRKHVTRHADESSWDTLQRLAQEVGYLCFEAAGVLYFGKPTWLVANGRELRVTWRGARTDDSVVALPACRRSGDDPRRAATVGVDLLGDLADTAAPGMALVLDGVPTFDGRYLVDTVELGLAEGQPATVSASTPINPKPEPPAKASSGSSSSSSSVTVHTTSSGTGGATGRRSAAAFVAVALDQAGDRYIYGAETSSSDPNPNAFDCSELVQWALGRVGVTFVDGSSAQLAAVKRISVAQAINTRGALLFHPGHVAISLGNGRTIEAANSRVGVVSYSAAGRFTAGGLVPGLRY